MKVLLAEDEFLLSVLLEEHICEAGYEPVGPYGDLTSLAEAATKESFDFAILDVNLNGDRVFPVAKDLVARGVPLIFLTGYAATSLPAELRSVPVLAKPYTFEALKNAISRLPNMPARLNPAPEK